MAKKIYKIVMKDKEERIFMNFCSTQITKLPLLSNEIFSPFISFNHMFMYLCFMYSRHHFAEYENK